ncbi:MAG: hypothetical protein QF824_00495 [Candidatus Woesearchaeota archaeon]|jgi:hypothetical protein|nr:hypothetical protein [Candidatus Woesearchaeota archaeon]
MRKYIKNFSVFLVIGAVQSVLQVFLLWVLIDILKFNTLIITTIVTIGIYVAKYYVYVFVGLMKNQFMKYNVINLATMVVSILAIWILVDFFGWYASISTMVLAVIFLVLRFVIFDKAGMVNNV